MTCDDSLVLKFVVYASSLAAADEQADAICKQFFGDQIFTYTASAVADANHWSDLLSRYFTVTYTATRV